MLLPAETISRLKGEGERIVLYGSGVASRLSGNRVEAEKSVCRGDGCMEFILKT